MTFSDERITLYCIDTGTPIPIGTRTWEEWFQLLSLSKEEFKKLLGVDHSTIIGQLNAHGCGNEAEFRI